jgi:hypothetical protein
MTRSRCPGGHRGKVVVDVRRYGGCAGHRGGRAHLRPGGGDDLGRLGRGRREDRTGGAGRRRVADDAGDPAPGPGGQPVLRGRQPRQAGPGPGPAIHRGTGVPAPAGRGRGRVRHQHAPRGAHAAALRRPDPAEDQPAAGLRLRKRVRARGPAGGRPWVRLPLVLVPVRVVVHADACDRWSAPAPARVGRRPDRWRDPRRGDRGGTVPARAHRPGHGRRPRPVPHGDLHHEPVADQREPRSGPAARPVPPRGGAGPAQQPLPHRRRAVDRALPAGRTWPAPSGTGSGRPTPGSRPSRTASPITSS